MTGPVNCKKTTRYHAHLSLCGKSRKTNDSKSRKWPKTSIWATFFDDFEIKYLQIAVILSTKLKVILSTNFRAKTKKIVTAVFEKNIKVSDFGSIWRSFREYLQIKIFFKKNLALWLFYLYSPLTSCKKSEKCLEPFLRKLRYQPTNQPTSYYQQHQFYRTWLTPVQQKIVKNCLRPESGPLSKSDVKRYSIKYLIKIWVFKIFNYLILSFK